MAAFPFSHIMAFRLFRGHGDKSRIDKIIIDQGRAGTKIPLPADRAEVCPAAAGADQHDAAHTFLRRVIIIGGRRCRITPDGLIDRRGFLFRQRAALIEAGFQKGPADSRPFGTIISKTPDLRPPVGQIIQDLIHSLRQSLRDGLPEISPRRGTGAPGGNPHRQPSLSHQSREEEGTKLGIIDHINRDMPDPAQIRYLAIDGTVIRGGDNQFRPRQQIRRPERPLRHRHTGHFPDSLIHRRCHDMADSPVLPQLFQLPKGHLAAAGDKHQPPAQIHEDRKTGHISIPPFPHSNTEAHPASPAF